MVGPPWGVGARNLRSALTSLARSADSELLLVCKLLWAATYFRGSTLVARKPRLTRQHKASAPQSQTPFFVSSRQKCHCLRVFPASAKSRVRLTWKNKAFAHTRKALRLTRQHKASAPQSQTPFFGHQKQKVLLFENFVKM